VTSTRGRRPLRGRPQHHARAVRLLQGPALTRSCRQSDGKTWTFGVVQPAASPRVRDAGRQYANAAAQERVLRHHVLLDRHHLRPNTPSTTNLVQAPRGGFSGPPLGGFNNLPSPTMAGDYDHGPQGYGCPSRRHGPPPERREGAPLSTIRRRAVLVVNGHTTTPAAASTTATPRPTAATTTTAPWKTTYYGNATGLVSRGTAAGPLG